MPTERYNENRKATSVHFPDQRRWAYILNIKLGEKEDTFMCWEL